MNLSIPGKVFLLGEYSVLTGGRAILAAVGPRFQWTLSDREPRFHPKSPAGKFLQTQKTKLKADFHDPHEGRGGFGASTAQFAFSFYAAQGEHRSGIDAWQAYRDLHRTDSVPPSGADLLTQWEGGICAVDYSQALPSVRKLRPSSLEEQILVFTATHLEGRKVATHEHLRKAQWKAEWTADAVAIVGRAEVALAEDSGTEFGKALNDYAEFLAGHHLEAREAREDREAIASMKGVLGCKGTGALLSDVLIALVDDASLFEPIVEAAEARGLRLALKGITQEKGISPDE